MMTAKFRARTRHAPRLAAKERFVVVVAALAIALVVNAGTAFAEPNGGNVLTLTLYNCSGPAETPTSFTVQKELSSSNAGHVVGSTDIFRRTSVTDLTAGVTYTYGVTNDNRPLITCDVVAPDGHQLVVMGFFTG